MRTKFTAMQGCTQYYTHGTRSSSYPYIEPTSRLCKYQADDRHLVCVKVNTSERCSTQNWSVCDAEKSLRIAAPDTRNTFCCLYRINHSAENLSWRTQIRAPDSVGHAHIKGQPHCSTNQNPKPTGEASRQQIKATENKTTPPRKPRDIPIYHNPERSTIPSI